jgi:hypothetical protein
MIICIRYYIYIYVYERDLSGTRWVTLRQETSVVFFGGGFLYKTITNINIASRNRSTPATM